MCSARVHIAYNNCTLCLKLGHDRFRAHPVQFTYHALLGPQLTTVLCVLQQFTAHILLRLRWVDTRLEYNSLAPGVSLLVREGALR